MPQASPAEVRRAAEESFASGLYCAESVLLAMAQAQGEVLLAPRNVGPGSNKRGKQGPTLKYPHEIHARPDAKGKGAWLALVWPGAGIG